MATTNEDLTAESPPEKVRAAWVAALRSGEYKQGHGHLGNQERGYCCLGVLCDLAVRAGVQKTFGALGPSPTWKVARWAGLRTRQAEMDGGPSLSQRNDRRDSFSKIADVIESNPPGLFVEATS